MEVEVDESLFNTPASLYRWPSIEPTGLSPSGMYPTMSDTTIRFTNSFHLAVNVIGDALAHANNPLIITSHIGRNPAAVGALEMLSRLMAIPIFVTCPSATNVTLSHPFFVGVSFLAPGTHSPLLNIADVILVIDAEVPWIPMNKDNEGNFERPGDDARIFVLDSGDPLRDTIGMEHVGGVAELVCRASAETALFQILNSGRTGAATGFYARSKSMQAMHDEFITDLRTAETLAPEPNMPYAPSRIFGALRMAVENKVPHPASTLYLNESISNYPLAWNHLHPDTTGGMLSSGGSSLGWGLGASIGAVLGGVNAEKGASKQGYELVVSVVGDGSFLFGVPGSAFWMARRYETVSCDLLLSRVMLLMTHRAPALPDRRFE